MRNGLKPQQEDRLVFRRYNPVTKQTLSQGKRVPNSCKMTKLERFVYVKYGSLWALRFIMVMRGWPLRGAGDLLNESRGTIRNYIWKE